MDVKPEACCTNVDKVRCDLQLILEEFGKWLNVTQGATLEQRRQYLSIVYDEVNRNVEQGTPLQVSSVGLCSLESAFSDLTLASSKSFRCRSAQSSLALWTLNFQI